MTSAFDIIDHQILLEKMEHLGLRGRSYSLIESYLSERFSYCEVQGFAGKLIKCGPYSVIQGGKLSGQFYGIYTIEMTQIAQILQNDQFYTYITGENLSHDKTSETNSTGYVNDINHVSNNKDIDQLEKTTKDLNKLATKYLKKIDLR